MKSDDSTTIRRMVKTELKHQKKRTATKHDDKFCNSEFAKQIRGKPFWIEDEMQHELKKNETDGKCCFWHIVGLPQKEHLVGRDEQGKEILEKKSHPIYDYEIEVYNAMQNNRYIRIKKATGLGITTLLLGIIAYLCVRDNRYKKQEMVIVTGPRQELATDELDRLAHLFSETDYRPKRAGNSLWINNCKITSYPSHSFDSARGLDKCRLFFVDEADFFPQSQIEIVMAVLERYEAKSHPHVILNSTVNLPTGLYAQMDKGKHPNFVTIELFYKRGIGKIYTEYEIEQAKKMPSFEREYNGQYGLGEGNIFPYQLVDECVDEYSFEHSDGVKALAVDPAYGSSKFAIVAFEIINGIIYIDDAVEFERPSPSAMVDRIVELSKTHSEIVIDDSDPGLRRELLDRNLYVRTVNFKTELQAMTMLAAKYVKERKVVIHPSFSALLHQLKSVRFSDRGTPDKTILSFDLGDAFLMAVKFADRTNWRWVRF